MSCQTTCKDFAILISGVGGQGTLLASKILGEYSLLCGCDCKLSEVHGMAQRGGSVVTHFKMGKKIFSPVIEAGEADILLAFEALEAARYAHYLKKGGMIISNTQSIMPMPVVTGDAEYPKDIEGMLNANGVKCRFINAYDMAKQAGSEKSVNVVMIGYAAAIAGFDGKLLAQAVKNCVPEHTYDINLKALKMGTDSFNSR